MTQATQEQASPRKLTGKLVGIVVSDKMTKTRTVEVAYQVRHPKYGKYLHRATRYHAHDELSISKVNDRVEIAACRPYSKTKSWRIVRVVEAALPPVDAVKNPEGFEGEAQKPAE